MGRQQGSLKKPVNRTSRKTKPHVGSKAISVRYAQLGLLSLISDLAREYTEEWYDTDTAYALLCANDLLNLYEELLVHMHAAGDLPEVMELAKFLLDKVELHRTEAEVRNVMSRVALVLQEELHDA